jgi:hypothetical protein
MIKGGTIVLVRERVGSGYVLEPRVCERSGGLGDRKV